MMVRPLGSRRKACCTWTPVATSRLEVASSRMSTVGSAIQARAKPIS
jgi:hypothetical protein